MGRPRMQRIWLSLGLGLVLALGNSAWSQEQVPAAAQVESQVAESGPAQPDATPAVEPEQARSSSEKEAEAPAQPTAPERALKREPSSSPSSGKTLMNVMLALGAVIVMIFATGWLLKRFTGFSPLNNRHIKIHASLSVGARERIVLVEVGGEQILIGVTPQQINHLHTLKEPVVSPAAPAQGEFAQRLQAILGKGKTE